jgi:methylenetetrahydrofolate dehydrogenase (NADP+) / methenyltetrahydrofolate cyclohydrolase
MTASGGAPRARILDGTAAARDIYARLKERVAALGRQQVRPRLAAVQVGDNSASKVYLRNKVRACEEVGVESEVHHLAGDCPADTLLAILGQLNRDLRIHGILLQLPLPPHLDADRATQTIAPGKDVDGLTWASLGALVGGHPGFEPCTPSGVIVLLERAGVALEGRHAVVVGRSAIVGKPMALMLIARGATVTVCHTRTRDLPEHTRRADILVVAAGRAGLVSAAMVKPGAAVVDVGVNRLADGKLAGDVDFATVSPVAGWISPVPGGVGPMTVAMVIANTVQAAEKTAAARAG